NRYLVPAPSKSRRQSRNRRRTGESGIVAPAQGSGVTKETFMSTNRRDFIKFVVAGSVAAGCPIDLSLLAQTENPKAPAVEGEDSYSFAKEIGLEPLPVNCWDGTIVKGEFIADTWGDGLDKLPYPAPVREGFKKFKKEILAIDVQKRSSELMNLPLSDFMKGYPDELKQWWDAYGPSNWGA